MAAKNKKSFLIGQAVQTVAFDVEETCSEWISLSFSYTGARTWAHLTLVDPAGKVRYAHIDYYCKRTVVLHADPAQTSATGIPGAVAAGRWTAELVFPRTVPARMTLTWTCGDGPLPDNLTVALYTEQEQGRQHGRHEQGGQQELRQWQRWNSGSEADGGYSLDLYDWQAKMADGQRWYKGDMHLHTVFSDGKMTPPQLLRQAELRELDFIFATDHNLLPCAWPQGKTLVIPGMELTSFTKGDWNALGLGRWLDCWGIRCGDGGVRTQEGQDRLMKEVGQLGAFRTINHPLIGRAGWGDAGTPLAAFDAVEIWNRPRLKARRAVAEETLALWTALWNDGYQTAGIGGSDLHLTPNEPNEEGGAPSLAGDPMTCVYASGLSARTILDGLFARRIYVTLGPCMELSLETEANNGGFTFGDDVTEAARGARDGALHGNLTLHGAAGAELHIIESGRTIEILPVEREEQRFAVELLWGDAAYAWRRFDIRSREGELLAFSNPVFCGVKQPSIFTWGQLLAAMADNKEQAAAQIEGRQ